MPALSAVTVKTTVVAADRLSPRSESERDKESDTTCVAVGLSVRPLKAASRFAGESDTVNDAEPFMPVVTLKPVADASVAVPCATDTVKEFEPLPAASALKVDGVAVACREDQRSGLVHRARRGATIADPLSAVTMKTTGGAADRLLARSDSETDKDSDPTCVALGLEVRPLRASFKLGAEPDTVNEAEPFVPVVMLTPVVGPRVSLPCESDSESDSELLPAAASITEIAMLLPLEKTSDAVIVGATRELTVNDALVELDSASAG